MNKLSARRSVSPAGDLPKNMRYRDWLNLKIHLLWCHNLPVARGRKEVGQIFRSTGFTNSGAWLVKKGWAQVDEDGRSHRALPGQWLIVKPGKRVQTFSADAQLVSLAFDARWPDGSPLFEKGLSLVVDAADAPDLEKLVRPILRTLKQVNPDTWDARDHVVDLALYCGIEQLLLRWLVALALALAARGIAHSGHTGIDDRVLKSLDLLHAQDLDDPLDLKRLARRTSLSQNHLVRLFRRDLQTTPAQYWDRLRIEHARSRLLQPDARVKQVSIELGFRYLSHFSKWFKRHTGQTPRQLQHAHFV